MVSVFGIKVEASGPKLCLSLKVWILKLVFVPPVYMHTCFRV
mgnify:CR=1 FL=1